MALTPEQISQFRTQAGLAPTPQETQKSSSTNAILEKRRAALGIQSPVSSPTQETFKYDVGELTPEEQTVERNIQRSRTQTEVSEANADLTDNTALGYTKNFLSGLPLVGAPVRQGEKTGQQLATGGIVEKLVSAESDASKTRADLIKRIRENEASGKDTRRLKLAYNQSVDSAKDTVKELDRIAPGWRQTYGEAAGNLVEMGADMLSVGTYGKAKSGVPTIISKADEILNPTAKIGLKQVGVDSAVGAGVGYTYDVALGMQGARGEDRTGAKALIPGLGTAIGAAAPAVLRGATAIESGLSGRLSNSGNVTRLESKIAEDFERSIKPSIAGKGSSKSVENYRKNVVEAVKVINDNKPNLKFTDDIGEIVTGQNPKTLQQFSDAIEQTKKKIFNEYDRLASEAGEAGLKIDLKPIADELDVVINDPALGLTNPEAVAYAKDLKDRYTRAGSIDAKTSQDVIQNYNKSLEAYYRNPSYDNASQVAVDAMIANKLRVYLDDGINSLTGEQYGALKRQYGALKAVEKDVVKAGLRDSRKNTQGLIDYTDIFTGGDIVGGILTLNPAQVARGTVARGIKEAYKYLNSPNRRIQNMFNSVEKLNHRPNSQATKAVSPAGAMRLSNQPANKINATPKINAIDNASIPQSSKKASNVLDNEVINMEAGAIRNPFYKATKEGIDDNLIKEARKYKSPEEFVSKQPVVYHGSSVPLKKFSDKKGGVFFTDSMEDASGYAGGVDNVYEGYLNLKNPLVIDAKGAKWNELNTKWGKSTQEVISNARKDGYDGVTFKNIVDNVLDTEGMGESTVHYVYKPEISFVNESQLTDIWNKAQDMGMKTTKKDTRLAIAKDLNNEIDVLLKKGMSLSLDDFSELMDLKDLLKRKPTLENINGVWETVNNIIEKLSPKKVKLPVKNATGQRKFIQNPVTGKLEGSKFLPKYKK